MSIGLAITRFGGEVPKVSKQLLPDGYAQYSLNNKTSSGDLVPYRKAKYILEASVANALTIYPLGFADTFYWMMWNTDVDVVKSSVANVLSQRFYYSGDGVPKTSDINRATFAVTLPKSANYTQLIGDYEKTISFSVSGTTYSLLAAATAKNQFAVIVENTALSGNVTIDPSGAELVNGAATFAVPFGSKYLLKCNGTAWTATLATKYPYDYFELGVPAPVAAAVFDYDNLNKAAAYTVVGADSGKTINCSAGPWTLGLTAAATLGSTFTCVVRNTGTGTITIDPNGAETISGGATVALGSGNMVVLTCDGVTFTVSGITSGYTAYVYTYVTEWGEESAPSPASNIKLRTTGQRTILTSLPTAPPAGEQNIRSYRLYRSNTGVSGTAYQFVVETLLSTTSNTYTDNITNSLLGEVIPSTNWIEPPDDLKGFVNMANGITAAFHNNEVCFSEPYKPYTFPLAYRYSVDATVVGIAALGNSLVVTTEGSPYIATGNHPTSISMYPTNQPYPCLSKRGVVNIGTGVIYPTFEGLVFVSGSRPVLSTMQLFTRKEWVQYYPETLYGRFYDGKYIGSYATPSSERKGFVYQAMTDRIPMFVETNITSVAAYSDLETGEYYFITNDKMYQWDADTSPYASQNWWSREFSFEKPLNFGAALIEFDNNIPDDSSFLQSIIDGNLSLGQPTGYMAGNEVGMLEMGSDEYESAPNATINSVVFQLYVQGELKWTRTVTDNKVFRLPAGFKEDKQSFRVSSNVPIHAILVAETPQGLERIGGA